MIEITRYTPDYKVQWDQLIKSSRNATFLFFRDYMDYHSDRFEDCSFLFFRKGRLEAVLPGNLNNNSFFSHQGLTYGGLITSVKICTVEIVEIFNLLNTKLKSLGIKDVIYKPVPLIYHCLPSQEDLYALFLHKADRIGCNISSTIFQHSKPRFTESRKSGIRKSIREGVQIAESKDFNAFWEILNGNLISKFNTKPVHSVEEVILLTSRFPENIKLYVAEQKGVILAGTLLYLMKDVIHVQYISASEIGKEIGAIDLLFEKLINIVYSHIPIFDFGQSTEKSGNYLNENLIFQKEGFGGRGIVYDTYKYIIK
jgi:hypothetical protein